MRIAFDAKRMLNNGTGLGNHARILVNALMRDYPDHDYPLFAPKMQEKFLAELGDRCELHLPSTKLAKVFHPLWRSYGITKDLVRNRVDLYHGISNELPFNIHQSGIKSVVTIHDLIFLKHKEQYPWLDRQIYQYKTRYAAQHASHIIAVSEETKQDLISMYRVPEKKISVIYPSIDPRFFIRSSHQDLTSFTAKYKLPENYILNVGSFFPRKNQMKLIEAFELIRMKTDMHLVLAGNAGGMQEAIQKYVLEKGMTERIHLIEDIGNEDMPILYQHASLFVFPSLFEGFGAPVLEALVSGVPVIASHSGAIKEAAGKGSQLTNPTDAQEMADKMLMVLRDTELQTKMIAEGYAHAQRMTDTIFSAKTMKVYRDVLGR